MASLLRWLFFAGFVPLIVSIVLGLNVRRREHLPQSGPALIVANHNSHLDTLVLMSLFPLRLLPLLRPVAASDYFLRNRALAWFALNVIGIIAIGRRPSHRADPLAECGAALSCGQILILFPEGSRGEPERLASFKTGVAHLAERFPTLPVIPVFMHGLGKALPKGEALLVPFFCDVFVGSPLFWAGDRRDFMLRLESAMRVLAEEDRHAVWD